MKLGTIKVTVPSTPSEARDGRLVVVSPDMKTAEYAPSRYPNLLAAMDSWTDAEPELREIARSLVERPGSIDLGSTRLMAPLPRTWQWLDGSAFVQHVVLVRKARNAEPPDDLFTIPLMYQGLSDPLLGPCDDIPLVDEAWGLDFEGEFAIVTGDVPMGCSAEAAKSHVRLIVLMNDVSLRNLIPRELATSFGFFHGKPSSAFAPFAVTPDELGDAWRDGRVHLELESRLNGRLFGHPHGGEMHFSFFDLIAHASKTRSLTAGTIIGSGTVSNKNEEVGSSCLAERRMLEQIHTGQMRTPFMKPGDIIEMESFLNGRSVFGKLRQRVKAASQ